MEHLLPGLYSVDDSVVMYNILTVFHWQLSELLQRIVWCSRWCWVDL